jgi:uncharacterized protein YggE
VVALENIMSPRFCAALLAGALLAPPFARAEDSKPERTISVSGTAEVRVLPDEVNLRLGIETRAASLDEAMEQNEGRVAAVLKYLQEAGVDSKNVRTDFLQIEPQYDRRADAPQIVPEYYRVRRNLGVRLADVSRFDKVLAGVMRNGVNHVDGVEFRTTELRQHRDAARKQAARAAQEKAAALAGDLGARLGEVQTIQEQTGGGWWSRSANPYSNAVQNVAIAANAEGGASEFAVGMINVTATVQVTFRLK